MFAAQAEPGSGRSFGSAQVRLGQVEKHHQLARTGTRAHMRWEVGRGATAAWFKGSWPPAKSYVLARGEDGHGRHHNEWVFYARVLDVLSPEAKAAYQRQHRRSMARLEHGPVRLEAPGAR